jgi:alpha-tubulin suppressor-like RCC1 family protein
LDVNGVLIFGELERMKKPIVWLVVAVSFFLGASLKAVDISVTNCSQTVVGRGAHHRIWREVTLCTNEAGTVSIATNSYTEIQTGLNYLHNGQWTESSETIDLIPGGAGVNSGPHIVEFSANINSATGVKLVTPDSETFESHILGLGYYDPTTDQSVLIAELKDCIGEIRGDNQVVYADAFTDFKADVRYTYLKSGFEQDIIFQEQPPTPAAFGLSAATRLQVLTEFFNPPVPQKIQAVEDNLAVDEYLNFGAMTIGLGRAFLAGEESAEGAIQVSKHWQQLEGRDFLIEEVKYAAVQEKLLNLPIHPVALLQPQGNGIVNHVSLKRLLPAKPTASLKKGEMMRVASSSVRETGFVMDYALVNNGSSMTFKSDTTYYVSGLVTLTGTNVIEGGTVIKFTNNLTASISISLGANNTLTSKSGPYRPAIFTSKDDNTVGDPIPNSTGSPVGSTNGNVWLKFTGTNNPLDLKYLRISYAPTAVSIESSSPQPSVLSHVQLTHSKIGLKSLSATNVSLRNGLFYDVATPFDGTNFVVRAEHLTANQFVKLTGTNLSSSVYLTNCLLVGATNLGSATCITNATVVKTNSGTSIFTSIGAGSHYLIDDPSLAIGTTNINSSLLADLRKRTVFPPVVSTNVISSDTTWTQTNPLDTNANLFVGYHYDSLSCVVSNLSVTNATLKLTNGVGIAFYGSSGFRLQDGARLISEGTPTALNHLVRYSSVQEMANTNWHSSSFVGMSDQVANTNVPCITLRFTDVAMIGTNVTTLSDNGKMGAVTLTDCQFVGGILNLTNNRSTDCVIGWTNNLFERNSITLGTGSDPLVLKVLNNTFEGGMISLKPQGGDVWDFRHNLFNGVSLSQNAITNCFLNSTNAYSTNTTRILPTNSLDIVLVVTNRTGALGNFYQRASSALIDKGVAAGQLGLAYHTVTTNQVPELNTAVDFGFHYVAVDQSGSPLDSDGDGQPDYLEDSNRDGVLDSGETSPYDFFNGIPPTLHKESGDGQTVLPHNFLATNLMVSVMNGTNPLVNAPVTFTVSTNASVLVSAGQTYSSVTLRTGADGAATISNYIFPDMLGGIYTVTARLDWTNGSTNQVFTETIADKVFTPILSQTNGSFALPLNIMVTCATPGATVHYTMNGTDPTENDPIIPSGIFTVSNSITLKVAGFKTDFARSDIMTGIFTRSASISAGYSHSLVADSEGKVFSWGWNQYGQLGDGTLIDRSNKVDVLVTNNSAWAGISQVWGGNWFSLALKTNGTVWGWGNNVSGQLGIPGGVSPKIPTLVTGLSGVISIAASDHSMVLKTNGLVYTFGPNGFGQLGDGTTTTRPTNVLVSNLTNVIAISAGDFYSMALKSDGTVWTWGYGNVGRLGNGTNLDQHLPVTVTNVSGAYCIAAGQTHALAACSNGLVYAWGENVWGGLGDGTTTTRMSPVQVAGLSNVVSLAAGNRFSVALDSSHRVWSWGENDFGQLGLGYISTKETNAHLVVGLTNVVAIAAGEAHAMALQADGSLMVWGHHELGQTAQGEYDFRSYALPLTGLTNIAGIAAGSYHNMIVDSNGLLSAWGDNSSGQIGNNSTLDQPFPLNITNGVRSMSGGLSFSLALMTNGQVLSCGYNLYGQLGIGDKIQQLTNRNVLLTNPVSKVAAGAYHALALDLDGRVWGWGRNATGEMGPTNATTVLTPYQLTNFARITNLTVGVSHNLAVDENGFVWGWGLNDRGQLGNGTTANNSVPTPIAGLSNIVDVAAGSGHSLFLTSTGKVFSCGYNAFGQLGDGGTIQRTTFVGVIGLSNIVAVAASGNHSFALDSQGVLWGWGRNTYGELGITASSVGQSTPSAVLTNVLAVATGLEHSIALLFDRSVWAFGHSAAGQLGNGNLGYNHTPVLVANYDFNDPPQILAPYSVTGYEDRVIVFTNLSIMDLDASESELQLTLSVSHGTIQITNVSGLYFVSSNSASMTVTGTQVNLNNGLSSLFYLSDTNYNGTDALSIIVDDHGHSGRGGTNINSVSVSISISPVSDAPSITVSSTNILEDAGVQTITITGIGVGPNEADQSVTNLSAVSSNPGLIANPTIDYVPGQSTATVTFTSITNGNGSTDITVLVQDNGNTAYGGTNASTRSFTVVVTAVNDAPSFGEISDLRVNEDALEQTIILTNITVGPTNESDSIQGITVHADNTNLFSSIGAVYTNGTTALLSFVAAPNANGTSLVSVVVQDTGGTTNGGVNKTTNLFTVTVVSVNDAPTLNPIGDVQVLEDSASQIVPLSGISPGPTDETAQVVSITASSGNTNLANVSVAYTNGFPTGGIIVTPVPNAFGTTTVSVVVQDDGGNANGGYNAITNTFSLTINPVNDAPTLDTITNRLVNANTVVTIPLTGISAGIASETAQGLVVTVIVSDTNLVLNLVVGYTNGNSSGTLTFQSAPNDARSAVVSVIVTDDGGTSNGGISAVTNSFTVIVNARPLVSLTGPTNNSVLVIPTNILLVASSSDSDGTVTDVQFFNGTNLLGTATDQPYSYAWYNTPVGSYALTAVATDNLGVSATSSIVNVTVTIPTNNLKIWLKADAGVMTNASGLVTNWADQSGQGIDVGQTSTNRQPFFVANGLNGKPAIRFSNTATNFLTSTNNPLGTNEARSVFVVAKAGTNSAGGTIMTFGRSPSYFASQWFNLSGTFYVYTDGLTSGNNASLTANAQSSITNSFIGVISSSGTGSGIHPIVSLNGTNQAVSQTGFVSAVTSVTNGVSLGHREDVANQNWKGDIAEILVYNTSPTTAERLALEQYLNTRYGVVTSQPIAPSSLAATSLEPFDAIKLTWTNNGNASTAVQIQRKAFGETAFATIATVPITGYYVDGGLLSGVQYTYRIAAVSPFGFSPYSSECSVTITGTIGMPISSAKLWLKAESGVIMDTNGYISTWADQGTNLNSAIQNTTASRPILKSNSLNGHPVISFYGTNYFDFTTPGFMVGAGQAEIVAVMRSRVSSAAAGTRAHWYFGHETTSYPSVTGTIYEDFGLPSGRLYDVTSPSLVLTNFHVYDVVSQTNDWAARVNGLVQRSTTNNTPYFANSYLGKGSVSGPNFDGEMAEVMIFNRGLTSAERDAVGGYLAQKYALIAVPNVPTGLQAQAIGANQISLVWSNVLNTAKVKFTVERSVDGASWAQVAVVESTGSYIDANGLAFGTTYYYRIKAGTYGGESDYSNVANATTTTAGAGVPLGSLRLWLKADTGYPSGKISNWIDQSTNGNNAIQFTGGNSPIVVGNALNGRPVVSYYGSNYFTFSDALMSGLGESEIVAVMRSRVSASATTRSHWYLGVDSTEYPSSAGTIVEDFGRASGQFIDIGRPPSITNFHVYSVVSKTNEWAARINGTIQYRTTNSTPFFFTGSRLGKNYNESYFDGDTAEVMIFDRGLTSAERDAVGNYLAQKYALVTPPTTPVNLAAQAIATNQISLVWSNDINITQVIVERSLNETSWSQIASVECNGSYIDTNSLASGTTYYYRVKAVNYGGTSGYSAVTNATTLSAGAGLPFVNLKLWLRADGGHGQGPVSFWRDQSGNDNDAYQASPASRPISSFNTFNGRPAMRFYGSNAFALPNVLGPSIEGEAIVVLRTITNSSPNRKMLWQFGAARGNYPETNGIIYDDFGSAEETLIGSPPHSLTNVHLFDALSHPDERSVRINGVLEYFTPNNTVVFSQAPYLGAAHFSDSGTLYYFFGDIAEVMVFDKRLSASERQAVGAYLCRKYAFIETPNATTNLVGQMSPTYRGWLNQVALSWDCVSNEATFNVERSPDGDAWEHVALVENGKTYTELVASGASFYYRVKAMTYGGQSGYSDAILLGVNQAPSFLLATNAITVLENTGLHSIPELAQAISLGASNESNQTILFETTNDYPSLFTVQPFMGTNGALQFEAATNTVGSAKVTIVAQDNGGIALGGKSTSALQLLTITVAPVNQQPLFSLVTDSLSFLEDAPLQHITNFATNILAGMGSEFSQTVSFVVTPSDTNFFSVQPALTSSGDLTFQLATNINGSNMLSVQLQDDGGTQNGGLDLSTAHTFTLFVQPVNDRPGMSSLTNRVLNGNVGPQTVSIGNISFGPSDESTQLITNFVAVCSDLSVITNLTVEYTNGNSTATLTFTPVPLINGSATIAIFAEDNGGTANGGMNVRTNTFSVQVNGVNVAPTVNPTSDLTISDQDCPVSVALTGISCGGGNSGQGLTITASSSNSSVLLSPTVSYVSPATNGTLTFAYGGAPGTTTVTVVVQDDGGTANGGTDRVTNTFAITVVQVPEPFNDDDYDGVSNLQEYRDGTDSHNPASVHPVRLGYWKFDTTGWIGEAGQLPLLVTNVQSVASWSSNALRINTNTAALLSYREVETNSATANINCQNGTIRFWFKPDWNSTTTNAGTGPSSDASLIDVGNRPGDRWALILNTNGTQLSFITQTNGVAQTNCSAQIQWSSNEWHQIVMAYTQTNTGLYIDGIITASGTGLLIVPESIIRRSGFTLASDADGLSQANGSLDELETFNYQLSLGEINLNYHSFVSDQYDYDQDGFNDIVQDGNSIPRFRSPSGLISGQLQVLTPLK